jgi:ornithine cyclodeaminase
MQQIDSQTIYDCLPYEDFIPFLRESFTREHTVPPRMHNQFGNGVADIPSTLLLMPAWQDGKYLGIKAVTVSPHNSRFDLPSIQGVYLLFDTETGSPLATFDASAITARRTAAKSAVASSFLSREDAEILLMVGTGTLSTELIQAHCTVRPIKEVIIWEHTEGKGDKVIDRLPDMNQKFSVTNNLSEVVSRADIISVATLSVEPLVKGKWLQAGQHIDTVGAYRTDMREADDKVLERSTLFIDHEDAYHETGDLAIPLENGVISKDDIKATLFELCNEKKEGRKTDEEITFFKSTGHALEDLSAALFVYEQLETN